MPSPARSGESPFQFAYRADLHTVPDSALEYEVKLHGGFAVDPRAGQGQIFYGMPGFGLLRIDPELRSQQLIPLPDDLKPLNFHSTKIGMFEGQWRLYLPAESAAKVAVLTLDGALDFVVPRPEFEQYADPGIAFNPTDTALIGHQLFVADGYGANYISMVDLHTRRWASIWGGKTEDPEEDGKFATAHGLNPVPLGTHLAIADRPSSRIQEHGVDGLFLASHKLPKGAWPCGINFFAWQGHDYAVIGNLQDPVQGRPAPIYVLDAEDYSVLSIVRPKEELGVELAQHLHNVIACERGGTLYLVCQSWNPGYYFVLEAV